MPIVIRYSPGRYAVDRFCFVRALRGLYDRAVVLTLQELKEARLIKIINSFLYNLVKN